MNGDEREAIVALRRGDIAGLETLARLHQVRALRAAHAILGERQAAEDVVADAFLAVYDHIGQFDDRRPFGPWFYRIVANGALKAVRSQRHGISSDGGTGDGESADTLACLEDPAADLEGEVARRELRDLVRACIGTLPPDQRAAIVLRYYLDMDEHAIAQTLGCPPGTVKWRLHRARKRIWQSLAGADDALPGRYLHRGETL